MGNSQPKKSTANPQLPRQRVLHGDGRRTCVVLGATGATGKELVYQLCQSKEWGRITIIHRRELDLKTFHTGLDRGLTELSEDEKNKVVQHVVNLDELKSEANIKLFANHDICFCMLGLLIACTVSLIIHLPFVCLSLHNIFACEGRLLIRQDKSYKTNCICICICFYVFRNQKSSCRISRKI